MTETERVLDVLLHDLRTPIGVAQGYLRLIKEGHLAEAADRERAILKTLDALGHTARLCHEAAEFLESPRAVSNANRVTVVTFASHVETAARQRGLNFSASAIREEHAALRLMGNVEAVSDAVVTVLLTPSGRNGSKRASSTVHMRADSEHLRFATAPQGVAPDFEGEGTAPFDRCWSHGLGLAAACRRVARSSGHIVTVGAPESGSTLIVSFPLEKQAL